MSPHRPAIPAVMLSGLLAVLRKTLGAVLDRLHRDLGAFPPDDVQFFVLKLVGSDEQSAAARHQIDSSIGASESKHVVKKGEGDRGDHKRA